MRLDTYLTKTFAIQSRTKAKEYIQKGYVSVDATVITKPSFEVTAEASVELKPFKEYVSRAAWKLVHFLDSIDLEVKGKEALDIGSSTGGFTQVLLERGVQSVTAVDVGTAQLHPRIKNDPRVISFESTDIRKFEHAPFELVVSDVSFISLLKILDAVDRLSSDAIILLFKPQFEVGVGVKRDKKGVVKDKRAIETAMERFETACIERNWRLRFKEAAHITGKEGNLEYCYYFTKR